MKILIDSTISINEIKLVPFCASVFRQTIGLASRIETIPLNTRSLRYREVWDDLQISMLHDNDEIVYILFAGGEFEFKISDTALPGLERDFKRVFPDAQRDHGDNYILRYGSWRLDLQFSLGKKRRGIGSCCRRLTKVYLARSTNFA
ncbi:hypothetical protein [Nibricoccus sp. IMCC34717]|uniref:hypothetical protein n=1 Tax=Nibricoccus sp. IMCC34717 TaxID=3034021 RepID=UPI00384BF119